MIRYFLDKKGERLYPKKFQTFNIERDQIIPPLLAKRVWNTFKWDVRSFPEYTSKEEANTLNKLVVLYADLMNNGRFDMPINFNKYSYKSEKNRPYRQCNGEGRMLIANAYAPNTLFDFIHWQDDYGDESVVNELIDFCIERQQPKDYLYVDCYLERKVNDPDCDVFFINELEFLSDRDDRAYQGQWFYEVEDQLDNLTEKVVEITSTMPSNTDEDLKAILDAIVSLPYSFRSNVFEHDIRSEYTPK